jgi:hypothetical protein
VNCIQLQCFNGGTAFHQSRAMCAPRADDVRLAQPHGDRYRFPQRLDVRLTEDLPRPARVRSGSNGPGHLAVHHQLALPRHGLQRYCGQPGGIDAIEQVWIRVAGQADQRGAGPLPITQTFLFPGRDRGERRHRRMPQRRTAGRTVLVLQDDPTGAGEVGLLDDLAGHLGMTDVRYDVDILAGLNVRPDPDHQLGICSNHAQQTTCGQASLGHSSQ